jgi:hypothetical protein
MEVESYLDLLAAMATGTFEGAGKRYVNQRLLRKRKRGG